MTGESFNMNEQRCRIYYTVHGFHGSLCEYIGHLRYRKAQTEIQIGRGSVIISCLPAKPRM